MKLGFGPPNSTNSLRERCGTEDGEVRAVVVDLAGGVPVVDWAELRPPGNPAKDVEVPARAGGPLPRERGNCVAVKGSRSACGRCPFTLRPSNVGEDRNPGNRSNE